MQPDAQPDAKQRLSAVPGLAGGDTAPPSAMAVVSGPLDGTASADSQAPNDGQDSVRMSSFAFASGVDSTRAISTGGALADFARDLARDRAAAASQLRTLQQLKHLQHLHTTQQAPAAGPELPQRQLDAKRQRSRSPPQPAGPTQSDDASDGGVLPSPSTAAVRPAADGRGYGGGHGETPSASGAMLRPVAIRPGDFRPGDMRLASAAGSCPPAWRAPSSPLTRLSSTAHLTTLQLRPFGSTPGSLAASPETASPATTPATTTPATSSAGCQPASDAGHEAADMVCESSVSSAEACALLGVQNGRPGGDGPAGRLGGTPSSLKRCSPSQGGSRGSPHPEDLQMPSPASRCDAVCIQCLYPARFLTRRPQTAITSRGSGSPRPALRHTIACANWK